MEEKYGCIRSFASHPRRKHHKRVCLPAELDIYQNTSGFWTAKSLQRLYFVHDGQDHNLGLP